MLPLVQSPDSNEQLAEQLNGVCLSYKECGYAILMMEKNVGYAILMENNIFRSIIDHTK